MTCQPAYSILRRCDPAHSVLKRVSAKDDGEPNYYLIAQYLGLSITTVIRWTQARGGRGVSVRGTGGVIPAEYHDDLITLSYGRVSAADFIPKSDGR